MLEGAGRAGSKKIRNKLTEIIKTPIVINRKTIFLLLVIMGDLLIDRTSTIAFGKR
jgi:hypothetical protein